MSDTQTKNAAQILGRLGGLKGGPARARRLNAHQRSQSASKAAKARWDKVRRENERKGEQ